MTVRPLRTWALALRIARREALRNKGRSLMVVAMLALPVAGASAADTLWRSSQVTDSEQAVRDMGRHDARVFAYSDAPLYQNATGSQTVPADPAGPARNPAAPAAKPGAADLARLLPAGARIDGPLARGLRAIVADSTGRRFADVTEIDLADPLTAGMARHRAGAAPAADDQVAISTRLAHELGKGVGDNIDVRLSDFSVQKTATTATTSAAGQAGTSAIATKTLRISGVYDNEDDLYSEQIFARPGTFGAGPAIAGGAYLVGVLTGVAAALAPALVTARQDVLAALPAAGVRPARRGSCRPSGWPASVSARC